MKRVQRFPLAAATVVAAALLVLTPGCAAEKKARKEQATKEWNAARAAVLINLARDQYKAGAFEKCRNTLNDAVKLVPENAQVYVLSAKVYIEENKLEQAERELKLARQYAPNDGEAHYLSGVIYQRWQKPDVAHEFYKTAGEKSPAELAYLLAQAEMLVSMDKPQDALTLLEAKLIYFEHSGVIRDAVARLYQQVGRKADAVAMFRQASILSEDDHAVRERLAFALYYNGEHRECAEVIQKLVQNEAYAKRGDLFALLGECQLQAGKARLAKFSFETASQYAPDSANVWRGLGRAALELDDLKRAELSLARAVKLDPAQAETHLLTGYVHLRQGHMPQALSSFQQASKIDPNDTVSLCMVGYVHEKLGQPQQAGQCYEKALRMKPGDDLATRLMAGADLND
jgi:tetratricopeptide (TPR) repeat protein